MLRLATLATLLAVLLGCASAQAAPRRVPTGWLGVVADGPLTGGDPASAGAEWDRMATSGTESVRIALRWSELQPTGAGTIDFAHTDALVVAAATRGMSVLPVLQSTPAWAAARQGDPASPPASPAAFGRFLTLLAERYGPGGTFWAERPDVPRRPIRAWQIWNEPNITRYWSRQPFAKSYVRLLRAADRALHRADRGATLVLAGLPNFSWIALREIYRAGGRGHFDAVAVHPYTRTPERAMRVIRYVRSVMRRYRDRRIPVWVTELSWPAAKGKVPREAGFETTDRGQARLLGRGLRLLSENRRRYRIARVFWYTWLSAEGSPNSFDYSGLRRIRDGALIDAPALSAYARWARRLEGCRKAPADARRCA